MVPGKKSGGIGRENRGEWWVDVQHHLEIQAKKWGLKCWKGRRDRNHFELTPDRSEARKKTRHPGDICNFLNPKGELEKRIKNSKKVQSASNRTAKEKAKKNLKSDRMLRMLDWQGRRE